MTNQKPLKKAILNIIHHSHWDREWYRSFEDFRFRLGEGVAYIDELFREGQISNFLFDGQTIVIEDTEKTISEDLRSRLLERIRQGEIEIGPWYVLPDEFLISGESVIRNLRMGIADSLALGTRPVCGYMPDTFGHISQMPQIFEKCGLESALIFRGTEFGPSEAFWESPDGTAIFTFVLPFREGYYQPLFHSREFRQSVADFAEKLANYSESGELLMLHGADHTLPPRDIHCRITELSKDMQVRETGLREFSRRHQDFSPSRRIFGEQRDNRKAYIFPGVYSSRLYLKKANQDNENFLSRVMEPLSCLAPSSAVRGEYEEHLWRLLLQNHPHDSICGCSIDQVHRDMMSRFAGVKDGARRYTEHLVRSFSGHEPLEFNDTLFVFLPSPHPGVSTVEARVFIPVQEDTGAILLRRWDGSHVRADLISRDDTDGFISFMEIPPDWKEGFIYTVVFTLAHESMGIQALTIIPVPQDHPDRAVPASVRDYRGEELSHPNHPIRLWVNKTGELTISTANRILTGVNRIYAFMDGGDSYNYSAPNWDEHNSARPVDGARVTQGRTFTQVRQSYILETPAGLDSTLEAPRKERTESMIHCQFTLRDGIDAVLVDIGIDNCAEDSVKRVLIPLDCIADTHVGDTAFDLPERQSIRERKKRANEGEEIPGQFPCRDMVEAAEIRIGTYGITEYDVGRQKNGKDAVALTLLRSTGRLSKGIMNSRGGGAGPKMATPELQCLGPYSASYSIGFTHRPEAYRTIQEWKIPPYTFQGRIPHAKKTNPSSDMIAQGLSLSNQAVQLSAFRRTNEGRMELRLWNITKERQTCRIDGVVILEETGLTPLLNKVWPTIDSSGKTFVFGPSEIRTFTTVLSP